METTGDLVNAKTAGYLLGKHPDTIRGYAKNGLVKKYFPERCKAQYLVSLDEVEALIELRQERHRLNGVRTWLEHRVKMQENLAKGRVKRTSGDKC